MTIVGQLEAKGIQFVCQEDRQESTQSITLQLIANGVERLIVKLFTRLSDYELDDLTRS